MAETRFIPKSLWLWTALVSMGAMTLPLGVVPAQAQSGNGVVVNLGVLNDLDPMATVPRLLMPSAQRTRGPIVLRPPPGVEAITPQRQRVVLRPPPGAPARVTSAATIAVPPPAAAAVAPPTSVTSAPPAPEPPPPAPAPVVAVNEAPIEDPAPIPVSSNGPVNDSTAVAESSEASQDTASNEPEASEQTASLPVDAVAPEDEDPLSILFGVEETELPESATPTLNRLVAQMNDDESLRVQLMAYASSADGSASSVRRKSLSRALSVREFLMDQGIQSTRIEVRALGDQNEGGEPNRVDAVIEQR